MAVTVVRLTRSRGAAGETVVRLGVPLLDEYLEFLAGRCRPNTVLAVAYDLKVFFAVVKKTPRRVLPADVLGFMTAQRTGGDGRLQVAEAGAAGVSARTLRRRLSSVSGLYGFLLARGDVSVNPVPGGCRPAASGSGPARVSRWSARPGSCRGSWIRVRWTL
jgi:integrase/recombinase XerD